MKGILFPRAYFFLQGANMSNVLMQICKNFSRPLQFVLIFSAANAGVGDFSNFAKSLNLN